MGRGQMIGTLLSQPTWSAWKADVIVAVSGAASQGVRRATRTIPIVMSVVIDPLEALSTFYLHSSPQMGPNEATQSDLTLRILGWCGIFPSPGSRTGFPT
jgi:hypothetical protein